MYVPELLELSSAESMESVEDLDLSEKKRQKKKQHFSTKNKALFVLKNRKTRTKKAQQGRRVRAFRDRRPERATPPQIWFVKTRNQKKKRYTSTYQVGVEIEKRKRFSFWGHRKKSKTRNNGKITGEGSLLMMVVSKPYQGCIRDV